YMGASLDNLTYTFDPLGRVSTFSSIDGTATYGYDPTSQLITATYTTATGGTQPPNLSLAFDPNGNRTAVNGTSTAVSPNNEVTNDGTFIYQFDAEGNRTVRTRISTAYATDYKATCDWDYRNRLTDVENFDNSGVLTSHVHYAYDVWDHLIERDVDPNGSGTYTQTVHYVWDASAPPTLGDAGQPPSAPGNIVLAFNASQQLTTRYLNGPSTSAYDQFFTALAEEDVNGNPSVAGTVYFYLLDDQGSLTDTVSSSGVLENHVTYAAFGQDFNETNPSVGHLTGFGGGLYDSLTELVNDGKRWYDPLATVWISFDPSGFHAGDMNLGRYVGNNPTNATDPGGLAEHRKKRPSTEGKHQAGEARRQAQDAAAEARKAEAQAKNCGKAGTKNINKRIDNLYVERKALERRNLSKPSQELEAEMRQLDDQIRALKNLRNARSARAGFVCLRPAAGTGRAGGTILGQGARRAGSVVGELAGPLIIGGIAGYDAYNSEYDDEHYDCLLGPHADRFFESAIDSLAIGNVPAPPQPREPQPTLNSSMVEGEEEPSAEDLEYIKRLKAIQEDDTPLAPAD
ncbi:MAG TPA: RHS repeat-associated core domain-containing protein, partial [Pirellulales bacterium]|nr:RHS repeat-associated core domain-containing protein [Pirellulales bacterium]